MMIELAVASVLIAMIIMVSLIYLKKMDHDFQLSQKQSKDAGQLSERLELKVKEFDDYKKRVDQLMLKTGFKL